MSTSRLVQSSDAARSDANESRDSRRHVLHRTTTEPFEPFVRDRNRAVEHAGVQVVISPRTCRDLMRLCRNRAVTIWMKFGKKMAQNDIEKTQISQ